MSPVPLVDWWPVARGAGAVMRLGRELGGPSPLPAHPGLWLDRMLAEPAQKKQEWLGRRQLYLTAVDALAPRREPPAVQAYRPIFEAWKAAMEKPEPGIARHFLTVEARRRILLHPASNGTVTEGSLLLHHTYGVPYLPGSALKGVLRSRLDRFAAVPGLRDLTSELLGDLQRTGPETGNPEGDAPGLASLVDFYDALWIPEAPAEAEERWSPLALDIVNPHHSEYYTGGGNGRRPPSDMDEPKPVHRLSLAPKTRFLIVAEAPDAPKLAPWLSWLLDEVLVTALVEDGIGAWTSAGYGRLEKVGGLPGVKKAVRVEEAPPDEWQTGHLFYEAGSGELRARLTDGRKPWASRNRVQELLASLPEGVRTTLIKRRREVPAEMKVSPEGLNWRIVAVREAAK